MPKEMTADEKFRLLEEEQNAGLDLKSGKRPVMTTTQAMGAMAGKPDLTDAEVLHANNAGDMPTPGGVRGAKPGVDSLWGFGEQPRQPSSAAQDQQQQQTKDPVSLAYQLLNSGEAESSEEAIKMARQRLGMSK